MTDHPALLHNMSAPPRTTVTYGGLGSLAKGRRSRGGKPATWPSLVGRPIRFCLPDDPRISSASQILRGLGVKPVGSADETLRRLIDECADSLPLPDGCAVIMTNTEHQVLWSDLLTTLAVLTKCSASVWLRAKTPSLTAGLARQGVSVLVPATFLHRLPKVQS